MNFAPLTYDAVAPLLTWAGAVEALRAGHQRPRPGIGDVLLGPERALLLGRAAHVAGLGYAVKAETVFADNAARGLPSIQGVVLLFDEATGAVRAIVESRLVTDTKTAADSVLGALLLARPDSHRLLIAGAGTVARNIANAYAAMFPLEEVLVWARRPEQAAALVATLDLPVRLTVADDLARAAASADIVATATMARAPILLGAWIAPGTHVDLIGAFTPEMREADDALMAKAGVWVDCRDTTVDRIGDLMGPIASGAMARADVRGDLYDMVAADGPLRRDAAEVTVFKNGGGAHLDLMIAAHVAEVAGR